MWVYGDAERNELPGRCVASLNRTISELQALPPGLARHARLAGCFIEASELVQGIADAEFEQLGCDSRSPAQIEGANLLFCLGRAVLRSWESGFSAGIDEVGRAAGHLPPLAFDHPVRMKRAEGYALYALYPEAFLEAARRSGLGPDTCVIGIRSIGTGLAALVAAALGAAPALTVRPIGDPFLRRLSVSPELAADISTMPNPAFAIVDEGPGLSGSSFAAVADWLEASGIARERIHFFPSHRGEPGGEASEANLRRWRAVPRHVVELDELILHGGREEHHLGYWVGELLGHLDGPLQEVSGGAWRSLRFPDGAAQPPVYPQQEKRKFLARARGAQWLVKFAGLGREGERKLEVARRLHNAGFAPEPLGLCHGFLVERWVDGVPPGSSGSDRSLLINAIGRYLGFRARELPASRPGASLATLMQMARYNTQMALGEAAAAALDPLFTTAANLEKVVQPIHVDGRLHAWEWVIDATGRIWKTDALDHAAAHDLVGCQDIAWDIAGAMVEHAFLPDEALQVTSKIEDVSGRSINRGLIDIMLPCYLAFQAGLWTYAAKSLSRTDADRAIQQVRFYTDELVRRFT